VTVDRVRVGDVLRLERREAYLDPTTEYALMGVYSFGKGIFHREPKPGAELGNYRFFAVCADDLVLSNIQAWEGAIARASGADDGIIGTHRFLTYVPSGGRIHTGWAKWFFLSETGMRLIRQAAPGTTMRNRTLAIERFEALEIPLLPIDEQRGVAHRLDVIAGSLEGMRPVSASSQAMAKALVPAVLHNHFCGVDDSTKLEDVASVRRGRGPSYAVDTGVVALNQACVRWSGVDVANAREVDRGWFDACSEEVRVRRDDVLVNSTGEGTIGRAAVATDEIDGLPFDSHVLAVRCDMQRLEPRYLAAYLESPAGQAQIEAAKGANTTKQTELGKTKLEAFTVPLPDIQDQRAFLARLDQLKEQHRVVAELVTRRVRLVDAVLPAALNEAFAGLS
jgi:type I restriction enzyme, S subunit